MEPASVEAFLILRALKLSCSRPTEAKRAVEEFLGLENCAVVGRQIALL